MILALVLAALAVPPLTGPVVDEAHVLSSQDLARLSELARAVRDQGGPQLGFLLVPSLEGEPIEDYSIRVAENWKLGTKGKDNGLLFVVAVQDHRMRIEVGGGLEGELTDAQSGQIIRNTLAPAFRAGQYGQGLYVGARQALQMIGVETPGGAVPTLVQTAPAPRQRLGPVLPFLIFIGVFSFIRLLGRRRRGIFWGGPWIGGGGFGGGGGGGGSWGGGGGGFSGGGASGSW